MKCSYCERPAVRALLVPQGEAPSNPKHEATQADPRRIKVIRFCGVDHKPPS